MANPQLEDGYTKIVNSVLDELINKKLSGQQLRIVLLIIRKTWGFNKKEDYVSLTQMKMLTGISKHRLSLVVNSLQLTKIITVNENINGKVKKYSINKNFDEWLTVNENVNRLRKKGQTVNENINPTVNVFVNHKRNNINKIIQKKTTSVIQKKTTSVQKDKKKINEIGFDYEKRVFLNITTLDKEQWEKAYPAINVGIEILKAEQWLIANPKNRKKNFRRFLTNWFCRTQEKAPRVKTPENDQFSMINAAKRRKGYI